jgi:ubiquinone/menaquinone biosynthesis C-methylase UbiE
MLTNTDAINLPDEPQEAVPCPLCGETSHKLVMNARDRLFGRPGVYPLVDCTHCGMRYLSPRPTLDAIGLHYPSSYFIYQTPEELPAFTRAMARSFSSLRWRDSLSRLEKALGPLQAGTKMVDVGCGQNDYLATLQRLRGVQGIGVDFNPEVAAYVRDTLKMPVHAGTLEQAHLPDGSVDIVTMNEYLEHEPNPLPTLQEARRITATGGHVVIEIPYIEGLPAKLFGSRWSQVDAPRHLVHFTRATLKEMLSRSGYELVNLQTFQIPYVIGFSALQALGHRKLGAMGFWGRTLVMLASLPFVPVFPVLDEFIFAVGRAK